MQTQEYKSNPRISSNPTHFGDLTDPLFARMQRVAIADGVDLTEILNSRPIIEPKKREKYDAKVSIPVPERKYRKNPAIKRRKTREETLEERRAAKRLRKIEKKLKKENLINKLPPEICPDWVWRMVRHILADHSGWAVLWYFKKCSNKAAVAVIEEAATDRGRNGYEGTRDKGRSNRARTIAALGLALVALGKSLPRLIDNRWGSIVQSFPNDFFLKLLADPFTGKMPSRSLLSTVRIKDKTCLDGQIGIMTALRRVGLFKSRQEKRVATSDDDPKHFKKWEKAHCCLIVEVNIYYVITDTNDQILDLILFEEIALLIFRGNVICHTAVKYFVSAIKAEKPPG